MDRLIRANSHRPTSEHRHAERAARARGDAPLPTRCRPTLAELIEAIGGTVVAKPPSVAVSPSVGKPFTVGRAIDPRNAAVGASAIDSRAVQPGEIFWALRGARCDGNEYAADALRRGAAAAVVERIVEPAAPLGTDGSTAIAHGGNASSGAAIQPWMETTDPPAAIGPRILVGHVPAALNRWAVWRRQRFDGLMIGVTGSAGKTTTRSMIDHLLGASAQGTATPGNWNNELGVPLSLARLQPGDDYAVIEMGARRSGDIAHLAALARPHWGVITCIGDAHLESFGSREAIAQTKTELLAALPADGLALLGDDDHLRRAARRCRCQAIIVGTSEDCRLRPDCVEHRPGSLRFRLEGQAFHLAVWGEHHLTSALLAAAAAREFGLDWPEIADRLAAFRAVPQRCQVFHREGVTIIDDTYNASPSAAFAALKLLGAIEPAARRIAILGEMAELGDEAASHHWLLGETAVREGRIDLLIACGPSARCTVAGARNAGLLRRWAIACGAVEELLPYVPRTIRPGDAVLIKGSRVMAMERVVEAVRPAPATKCA